MKQHNSIRDMVLLGMFGALLFAAKQVFEPLPNIHPVAMLIMVITVVYRVKGLIPLYIFILIQGLYAGFSVWWVPYLYIWTFVWALTMLIPQKLPKKYLAVIYPAVCAFCGLTYGTLYAPTQALMFGYDFPTTLKWIATGFPWDCLHAAGNLGMGLLVLPLSELLKKLNSSRK